MVKNFGTLTVGSHPLYQVEEYRGNDLHDVVIRTEDWNHWITVPRTALPALVDILQRIPVDPADDK